MKLRPVHLIWLLLFGATLAMGAVAFWLLGREAKRVESLARETLANRAATVADNLDFLMSEIRSGVGESLYALADAEDRRSGLARVVAMNPYIVAGFQLRESDGVTFWYGDRGSRPDPSQILQPVFLRAESDAGWVVRDSGALAEGEGAENLAAESMVSEEEEPLARKRAPTDQLGQAKPEVESLLLGESVPMDFDEEVAETQVESRKAKSALKKQIAVVRELNLVNRREILETQQESAPAEIVVASAPMRVPEAEEKAEGASAVRRQSFSALADTAPQRDSLAEVDEVNGSFAEDPIAEILEPVMSASPASSPVPVSGWLTSSVEGEENQLGWIRFPEEDVILGAWLDPEAIHAELAKAVYLNEREGLGIQLIRPGGEILGGGSTGAAYSTDSSKFEVIEIPVGPSLAGWRLRAFQSGMNPFGQSFRILGAVVVTGLVVAILSAGSLLLRQSRKDALEAQRKTTFVANVSHELKTPLTGIRMFAEMLAEGRVEDPAKQSRYLERISAETQRLGRLVNNVLDFSRLDRRKRDFRLESRNLADEVRSFLEMQGSRLAGEGLSVEFDPPAQAVQVDVDPDALEQILLNLLDNAVKYASEGERVCIEIDSTAEGVELRVRDFGPGIPPRERRRVFQAFHRVDDRLTSEQSGCGLGLSIGMRLAAGMGIELLLEENRPRGCCFILRWRNERKVKV